MRQYIRTQNSHSQKQVAQSYAPYERTIHGQRSYGYADGRSAGNGYSAQTQAYSSSARTAPNLKASGVKMQKHGAHNSKLKRRRKRRKMFLIVPLLLLLVLVLANFSHFRTLLTAWKLKAENYPDSLISLMERNPETTQFVLDYQKNAGRHDPIDLSADVTPGEIPLFLQWDERWGYETYGSDFLAITGCGPTCLSMVTCGLRGDLQWNPYEVARMAETQGYYVAGAGSAWDLMDGGASSLGLNVHNITLSADQIKDTLAAGMPIICTVGPGDFTSTGHFIVLSGLNSDGKIKVLDPNSIKNSEKSWDVEDLIPQIKNLWAYS